MQHVEKIQQPSIFKHLQIRINALALTPEMECSEIAMEPMPTHSAITCIQEATTKTTTTASNEEAITTCNIIMNCSVGASLKQGTEDLFAENTLLISEK